MQGLFIPLGCFSPDCLELPGSQDRSRRAIGQGYTRVQALVPRL